jgi:hypothetical protein
VKITPAHDFNDFEVGKRHDLPLINVLDAEARLRSPQRRLPLEGSPTPGARRDALALDGLDRFEARKRSSSDDGGARLLEKIEPHVHMVPHGDRSGVPIEPFLTDQWYVDAKTLAKPAIEAVRDGRTAFVPEELGEDLFRLDGEHPALVHLAPALVGPPDPGLVRAGRQGLRRREPRTSAEARAERARRRAWNAARREARRRDSSGATRTCSTPGSPPRCGRSRRSAGRTRRRS